MASESNEPLLNAREEEKFANPISSDPTRMPDIPDEIIVEILSRLPATSLLRFRCVCKPWLSLISDQKFIKKHLHMSTIDGNYSGHRVIFFNGGFKSCSLDSIFSDYNVKFKTLDHMITIRNLNWYDSVVGSCDGLVCICLNHRVYLSNPMLGEFRRLPRFQIDLLYGYHRPKSVYGFGYDFSIDDYKVVAVSFSNVLDLKYQVDVYTLRSNSWKRIEPFPQGRPTRSSGIYVNGALHWPLDLPSKTWTIIALDLATETCHEIAPPQNADVYYNHMLGVLGGCLCVMMAENPVGMKIDVWKMKEYGMENSWTKVASFPNLVYSMNTIKNLYPRNTPLFVSKIGEMLVIYKSGINLYNIKDDTFRSALINYSFDGSYSAIYVESLVSLGVEDSVEGQPQNLKKMKVK